MYSPGLPLKVSALNRTTPAEAVDRLPVTVAVPVVFELCGATVAVTTVEVSVVTG